LRIPLLQNSGFFPRANSPHACNTLKIKPSFVGTRIADDGLHSAMPLE
jgi:hypothetical protein